METGSLISERPVFSYVHEISKDLKQQCMYNELKRCAILEHIDFGNMKDLIPCNKILNVSQQLTFINCRL